MIQILAIMVLLFVGMSIYFLIKIKTLATQIVKSKDINNQENPLEKKYQFIKGLY